MSDDKLTAEQVHVAVEQLRLTVARMDEIHAEQTRLAQVRFDLATLLAPEYLSWGRLSVAAGHDPKWLNNAIRKSSQWKGQHHGNTVVE